MSTAPDAPVWGDFGGVYWLTPVSDAAKAAFDANARGPEHTWSGNSLPVETRRFAARHTRVPARLGDLPALEGRGPCLGEPHRRVVPDAVVGAPAPDGEPLDPRLRAPRGDAQIQPVLVGELRRPLGRLDLPYRQSAHGGTTFRPPIDASLPDSEWTLKESSDTDKRLFISKISTLRGAE